MRALAAVGHLRKTAMIAGQPVDRAHAISFLEKAAVDAGGHPERMTPLVLAFQEPHCFGKTEALVSGGPEGHHWTLYVVTNTVAATAFCRDVYSCLRVTQLAGSGKWTTDVVLPMTADGFVVLNKAAQKPYDALTLCVHDTLAALVARIDAVRRAGIS